MTARRYEIERDGSGQWRSRFRAGSGGGDDRLGLLGDLEKVRLRTGTGT